MSKIIKSKFKKSRSIGKPLWDNPKDAVHKKNFGPGQHGPGGRSRSSDYGAMLKNKQSVKGYLNLPEKQLKLFYQEADNAKGNTGLNLFAKLSRMLYVVVYQSNFASTIFEARQMVSHGHILVDGKTINIPTFKVKLGSVISLKESSKKVANYSNALESFSRVVPEYLEVSKEKHETKFLRDADFEDVRNIMTFDIENAISSVIELYSK